MAGNWLKLHRKALDSQAFANQWLWYLWSWCLMKACWKPCWLRCGRQLLPGQFLTGREQGASELRVSPSKWYRGMQILQQRQQVVIESNSLGTIVTICNWRTYQEDTPEEWTAGGQRVDSERTAGGQRVNTNKEGQEGQEGKESKSHARTDAFIRPTLDEVTAYCRGRGNRVDAAAFVAHYQSNGWKVGPNPMKDWKAAVRTWERNEGKFAGNGRASADLFKGAREFLEGGPLQ